MEVVEALVEVVQPDGGVEKVEYWKEVLEGTRQAAVAVGEGGDGGGPVGW